MSEEEGFLRQLLDHPDDDTTRLIYADWLEEHGDRRAEYLRLEVELAGLREEDERYGAVERLLQEMRPGIDPAWIDQAGKRFDVILHGYAPCFKIHVIKVIREITSRGLASAKTCSESLPWSPAVARPRAEAEDIRERLRSVGGEAEIDVELLAASWSRSDYGIQLLYRKSPNNGCWSSLADALKIDLPEARRLEAVGYPGQLPVIRDSLLLGEALALLEKLRPKDRFHLIRRERRAPQPSRRN
jgi:uncharacterized protein (TIGR02996 family)